MPTVRDGKIRAAAHGDPSNKDMLITIERAHWLSREKAAIKMAFLATTLGARRLHLDLAARLSRKAENLNSLRAVAAPAVRMLRPVREAIPRLLRGRPNLPSL